MRHLIGLDIQYMLQVMNFDLLQKIEVKTKEGNIIRNFLIMLKKQ